MFLDVFVTAFARRMPRKTVLRAWARAAPVSAGDCNCATLSTKSRGKGFNVSLPRVCDECTERDHADGEPGQSRLSHASNRELR